MPGSVGTVFNVAPGFYGTEDITGAKTLVESKYANASDIVTLYEGLAQDYLSDLASYFTTQGAMPNTDVGLYSEIDFEGDSVAGEVDLQSAVNLMSNTSGDIPTEPEDTDIAVSEGTIPELDTLPANPVNNPTFESVPTTTAKAHTPDYGTEPDTTVDVTHPGDAPPVRDPDDVKMEGYTTPTEPSVTDITITGPPDYSVPDFEGEVVTTEIYSLAPNTSFNFNEGSYTSERTGYLSALGLAISTKLATDVVEGTGLGEEVEDALLARAQDRRREALEAANDENENYYAARGFNLPTGAMIGGRREIALEETRAVLQIGYEILIEQARLAQNNTQFAIQQGISFESQLIAHFNKVTDRSLEASKQIVATAIEIYNAQVAGFNAEVDNYRAIAVAYSEKVKKALTVLEAWKIEVEGKKLEAGVQRDKIEEYKAKQEGVKNLVEIYKAKIQAGNLKVEADRARLEGFKTRLEAYIAGINVKTAEYGLYQARVDGEKTKVAAYAEELRAYGLELEAYKTGIDAENAITDRDLKVNEEKFKKYQIDIEKYSALLKREEIRLDALMKRYSGEADVFKARTGLAGEIIDAETKEYLGRVEEAKNMVELKIKEKDVNLQIYLGVLGQNVEIAKAAANIAAQISASALGSVNTSAGIQFSAAVGESNDYQYNNSLANRYDESHNFTDA